MKNGKPRKNKSDIYKTLLNSKVTIEDTDEYSGGNPKEFWPLCISFGFLFPTILATVISITTGSSGILSQIEGLSTIIPPAERSIQLTILTDGNILYPNGTLHRDELVFARASGTETGFERIPRGFMFSVEDKELWELC